jgi:hypothetical protein
MYTREIQYRISCCMCAMCRGGSDEGSPDGAYYFLLLVSFYWTLQVGLPKIDKQI